MLNEQQKVRSRRITVGADKAYDTKDFVVAARALNVYRACNRKQQRPALEPRPEDDTAPGLCPQPEPAMAGRRPLQRAPQLHTTSRHPESGLLHTIASQPTNTTFNKLLGAVRSKWFMAPQLRYTTNNVRRMRHGL